MAFFGYVKYLNIGNYRCLVEATAGLTEAEDEKAKNGQPFTLETPKNLIAYSSNVYEKMKTADNSLRSVEEAGNSNQAGSSQIGGQANHTATYDKAQVPAEELETLTICEKIKTAENSPLSVEAEPSVKDSYDQAGGFAIGGSVNNTYVFDKAQVSAGELAALTILDIEPMQAAVQEASQGSDGQNRAGLYAFDETRTKAQRQAANNAVFSILDRIDSGELKPENLTDADKAALAKYSGNGGGLVGRDGKRGSAHEYYTPAPVAAAMWDAVKDMGFTGGKVLDPCGGTGIFGALYDA